MLEILKEKDKEKIVFVKLGPFYVATGKDAVFLNKQLGLKCICFKKEVCKIGIPETRIEYYLEKLARLDVAYIVYCNEYKVSMYEMLENTLYIPKVKEKNKMNYLNKIDVSLNCQRIYLRIMLKNKWIDEKKFQIAISKITEIGKILGGLIKYYAKNDKK
jgi:DNA mismatch repair ATPase MutS